MNFLKHNLGWKIASLVIGFLLWSYITAGVNPTQEMTISDVAVQLENEDQLKEENYEIVRFKPEAVSVTVRGKRNDLGRLDKRAIHASIDASSIKEGSQLLPIHYETPDQVSLSSYSDYYTLVDVEKIVTQKKPVVVETSGELKKGLILEKLTPTPASLDVRGPRSQVDTIDHLKASLDLAQLTEEDLKGESSLTLTVTPVTADGHEVEGVLNDITEVNVAISVLKQRQVPIEVNLTGKDPEGLEIDRVQLDPDKIRIEGRWDQVDQIERIWTVPVDRADLTEKEITVDLDFPDGVRDVEDRKQVKLTVILKKGSLGESSGQEVRVSEKKGSEDKPKEKSNR